MATLLDGRSLAAALRQELKTKVAELNFTPRLGVILVGQDPASHLYVRLKEQAAQEVGLAVEKILLPTETDFLTIKEKIETFNQRPDIHAILIQLPLPRHLDENEVINVMDPNKDADGFHPQNLQRFLASQPAVTPGVTLGIVKLIESAGQKLSGKKAVLVVNSQEFAQPLVKLLNDRLVQTEVWADGIKSNIKQADIIIVARGRPNTITSANIKDGAIVIDVGTNKLDQGLVGDVGTQGLSERPIYLTPVPGGVGPMTVAMLLWNVYYLASH